MRNLKRALSLTLASVMLLGMMVVGASAKGYPDVGEEDNVEAIEVLQAIEVMRGDDNGNFNPDSPVTRSEMAVVMALLLNYDYQYYEATCPFWDVPTWARPYVGACYTNKIVSGYSANTYGAADGVTPVQAASMMMRALGYFQNAEDYADGFELSTVRQGTAIGIFDGVGSSATASMTRNQVAKMALNALRSEMVTFTGTPGTTYTASSGETLSIGYRAEYTPRTSTEAKYRAIENRTSDVASDLNHKGQYYVQLGEELYNGELKLNDSAIDAFGRPSRHWEYKGDAIGTYAKKELLVAEPWSVAVTGRTVYEALGSSTVQEDELAVYVDGALSSAITYRDLVRSKTTDLAETGRGVVTEVYRDTSGDVDEITIVIVNTYLAQAVNDYSAANESIRLDVYYDVTNGAASPSATAIPVLQARPFTIDVEDYPIVEDMKADDLVRVTMAAPDHSPDVNGYINYTVESIDEVEVVADVILSDYSAGNKTYTDIHEKRLSDVTTDGVRYNAAAKAFYDEELFYQYYSEVESQLRDATYNLYLDQFGNLLGIEQVEKADNYVFVVGYDQGSSVLAQAIDQALVIHTDGTMETVRADDSKLKVWDEDTQKWVSATGSRLVNYGNGDEAAVNAWFTYSEKSDGTLVLERMVKNQGIQNRYALSNGGLNPEYSYIDNMRGSLTNQYNRDTSLLAAGNTYVDYLGTGHDMRSAVAYGNDNSVYITVDADRSVDNNGSIVKVNGIGTGLRNVSIRPEDTSGMSNFEGPAYVDEDGNSHAEEKGIDTFFIYNDKGYVTYAVTVGKNGAAGYEYLYLNSAIKRTTNDQANDRYLYDYEVIRNGELVTIQSETPYAYESTALGGKLSKLATQISPAKGDLVRASIDKDGIVTEMVLLPETRINEMKPEYNDDYGYTLKLDYDRASYGNTPNRNPRDIDGRNITQLRATGNTLWVITEATEDNYTLLTGDARIFVNNPAGSANDYTIYSNAESAVNAVNNNSVVSRINRVATMNDGVTGYAHTVVIDVTYSTSSTPDVIDAYYLVLSGDLYDAKVYRTGTREPLSTDVNGEDVIAGTKTYRIARGTSIVIEDEDITWPAADETVTKWVNGVHVSANKNSHTMYLTLNGGQRYIYLANGNLRKEANYPSTVITADGSVSGTSSRTCTANSDGTYNINITLTAGAGAKGKLYNVTINGVNFTNVVADSSGILHIDNAKVTPKLDGTTPTLTITALDEVASVTYSGTSVSTGNTVSNVTFTLGQPKAVGALLPNEIPVGDGAVAQITWYDAEGNVVTGQTATATSGYTYSVTIVPAEGKDFAADSKVTINNTTPVTVQPGQQVTLEKGDTTPDVETNDNAPAAIESVTVTLTKPVDTNDELADATVTETATVDATTVWAPDTMGAPGNYVATVTLTAKGNNMLTADTTVTAEGADENGIVYSNGKWTITYTCTVVKGSDEPVVPVAPTMTVTELNGATITVTCDGETVTPTESGYALTADKEVVVTVTDAGTGKVVKAITIEGATDTDQVDNTFTFTAENNKTYAITVEVEDENSTPVAPTMTVTNLNGATITVTCDGEAVTPTESGYALTADKEVVVTVTDAGTGKVVKAITIEGATDTDQVDSTFTFTAENNKTYAITVEVEDAPIEVTVTTSGGQANAVTNIKINGEAVDGNGKVNVQAAEASELTFDVTKGVAVTVKVEGDQDNLKPTDGKWTIPANKFSDTVKTVTITAETLAVEAAYESSWEGIFTQDSGLSQEIKVEGTNITVTSAFDYDKNNTSTTVAGMSFKDLNIGGDWKNFTKAFVVLFKNPFVENGKANAAKLTITYGDTAVWGSNTENIPEDNTPEQAGFLSVTGINPGENQKITLKWTENSSGKTVYQTFTITAPAAESNVG